MQSHVKKPKPPKKLERILGWPWDELVVLFYGD
jgi:hypothetical protein